MKCDNCKIDYPGNIVNPSTSPFKVSQLCGVCALDEINKLHGFSRKTFAKGTKSETLRISAVAYRKKLERRNEA